MCVGVGLADDGCVSDNWGYSGEIGLIELNTSVVILSYYEVLDDDMAGLFSEDAVFKGLVDGEVVVFGLY